MPYHHRSQGIFVQLCSTNTLMPHPPYYSSSGAFSILFQKKQFETSTGSSRTGEGRWEANKYLVKAPLNLQSLVRKYSSCMTSWPPNSSPPAQLPGSNSGGFSNKQQLQTCFTKQCTNPCCLEGGTGLLEEQARPQGAISKGRLLRVGRQVTWAPVICWLITASFHLTRFIVKPAHNPLSV